MDSSTVKKVENEIIKEAKNEEKVLKHTLKDLSHTEKAEVKTHKVRAYTIESRIYLKYIIYRQLSRQIAVWKNLKRRNNQLSEKFTKQPMHTT